MAKWIPSWRYVPIDFNQELGVLENITQKSVFRNNIAARSCGCVSITSIQTALWLSVMPLWPSITG